MFTRFFFLDSPKIPHINFHNLRLSEAPSRSSQKLFANRGNACLNAAPITTRLNIQTHQRFCVRFTQIETPVCKGEAHAIQVIQRGTVLIFGQNSANRNISIGNREITLATAWEFSKLARTQSPKLRPDLDTNSATNSQGLMPLSQ